MVFRRSRLLGAALLSLAGPVFAAPLPETLTLSDHGRRAEFTIARDEVHQSLQPRRVAARADIFPAPAPERPYFSTFSVFNGQNSAGDWLLYIRDDATNACGGLGSWSLDITYAH